jgi:hypothetical protein
MPLSSATNLTAVAVLAVGLVGTLAIFDAAPASAFCRAPLEAYAQGYLQITTQLASRNRWRNEVRRRYGFPFSRWGLGKDKVERCRKLSPGRRWHCTARARPCDA